MSEFSPQTQAVWDAAYNTPEDCPYKHDLATALEAVADQVVPERQEPAEPPGYGTGLEPPEYVGQWTRWNLRQKLLAIAAEPRGITTTTQEDN